MSGFTIGEYELARREKEWLRLIEEENRKRLKEATDRYRSCLANVKSVKHRISAHMVEQEKTLEAYSYMKQPFDELKSIKKKYCEKIERLCTGNIPSEVVEINELSDKLEEDIGVISAEFFKKTEKVEKAIREYMRIHADNIATKQVSVELDRFSKRIKEAVRVDYADFIEPSSNKTEEDLVSKFAAVLQLAEECFNISHMDSVKSNVINIVTTLNSVSDKTYDEKKVVLDQIYSKLVSIKKEAIAKSKRFDALYTQYLAECILAGSKPMVDYSFTSLEALSDELKSVKKRAEEKAEHKYITEQINDVMRSMGYKSIDSQLLELPKVGTRQLFRIKENVALNVYASENNEVNTQLIIIGDSKNITEEDYEQFEEEQRSFCKRNPELVRRLSERGILIKNGKIKEQDKNDLVKEKIVTDAKS